MTAFGPRSGGGGTAFTSLVPQQPVSRLVATTAAATTSHLVPREHFLTGGASDMSYSTTTVISALSVGRSRAFLGRFTILSATSIPFTTSPNTVYCPSREFESLTTMKNCEPALLGSFVRAMERIPRR